MTDYIYSVVLILPSPYRDAGNQLAASMGWQPEGAIPGTYSIPLSATSAPTVITHYGCRAAAMQSFLDTLADPPPEAQPLVAALISDFRPSGQDDHGHFMDVIAANGLALYVDPEVPL